MSVPLHVPHIEGETRDQWFDRVERLKAERRAAQKVANRKAAQERRRGAHLDELRIIYADLPTCDDCGATDFKTTRTIESSPDGITRIVNCRECGAHFDLILLAKEID